MPTITQKNPSEAGIQILIPQYNIFKERKKKSNGKYFGSKINRDQKTPLGIIETAQSHNIIQVKSYNNKLQLYNGFSLDTKNTFSSHAIAWSFGSHLPGSKISVFSCLILFICVNS